MTVLPLHLKPILEQSWFTFTLRLLDRWTQGAGFIWSNRISGRKMGAGVLVKRIPMLLMSRLKKRLGYYAGINVSQMNVQLWLRSLCWERATSTQLKVLSNSVGLLTAIVCPYDCGWNLFIVTDQNHVNRLRNTLQLLILNILYSPLPSGARTADHHCSKQYTRRCRRACNAAPPHEHHLLGIHLLVG